MLHGLKRFVALAVTCSTASCIPFSDVLYDEKLEGPYRLHAVDTMESMAILWTIPDGGMVGDGLPGPTVFKAGHDNSFLIAAVHPQFCKPFDPGCSQFGMDRSKTEYWYVVRQPDERQRLPYKGIRGPFDLQQFAAEKKRLHLPEFSIRFRELE